MDRNDLIAWIKAQRYVGKSFTEREKEQVALLYRTLDRFCTYLYEAHGIERIEGLVILAPAPERLVVFGLGSIGGGRG